MYNRNYDGFDYPPEADRLSESTRNCERQCQNRKTVTQNP